MKKDLSAVVWQEGDWFVTHVWMLTLLLRARRKRKRRRLREAFSLHFTPPASASLLEDRESNLTLRHETTLGCRHFSPNENSSHYRQAQCRRAGAARRLAYKRTCVR